MVSGREPESDILDISQWFPNFDFSFPHYLRGIPSNRFIFMSCFSELTNQLF
jgi:hypothetical protein